MTQDQRYQKFDPNRYLGKEKTSEEENLKSIVKKIPKNITDIIEDIDQAVTGSNLSAQYRQQSGQ